MTVKNKYKHKDLNIVPFKGIENAYVAVSSLVTYVVKINEVIMLEWEPGVKISYVRKTDVDGYVGYLFDNNLIETEFDYDLPLDSNLTNRNYDVVFKLLKERGKIYYGMILDAEIETIFNASKELYKDYNFEELVSRSKLVSAIKEVGFDSGFTLVPFMDTVHLGPDEEFMCNSISFTHTDRMLDKAFEVYGD